MSNQEKDEFMEQEEAEGDWENADDDEGWDLDPEEPNADDIPGMDKQESSEMDLLNKYDFFKADEIEITRIPKATKKLDQTLKLENQDQLIAILRHFKWNLAKVNEEYFDDQERLEKKVGIFNFGINRKNNEIALGCGHFFDEGVWQAQMRVYLEDYPGHTSTNPVFQTCPLQNCSQVIPHSLWAILEPSYSSFYQIYIHNHQQQYIDSNISITSCKKCKIIIERAKNNYSTKIVCQCGNQFCYKCGDESHEPSDCEQIKSWNKNMAESEEAKKQGVNANVGYVREDFAAPCKNCQNAKELDPHCQAIECIKFNAQFCWNCSDTWPESRNKNCENALCQQRAIEIGNRTKFMGDKPKFKQSDIDGYKFFLGRFQFHNKVIVDWQQQKTSMKSLISNVQTPENFRELEFIQEAMMAVETCFSTLKWVQPLQNDFEMQWKRHQYDLFLFHQESLEEHCNGLKNFIVDKLVKCNQNIDYLELLRKNKPNIKKITDAIEKESKVFTDYIEEACIESTSGPKETVGWVLLQIRYFQIRCESNSVEYTSCATFFNKTCPQMKVQNVYRLQNGFLWDRYNREKEIMQSKLTADKHQGLERMLFHGCRTNAVENIKTNGFDIKYARAGMYGTGLYFAINSVYSASGYSTNNNDGTYSLFIAKVLTGDTWYAGKTNVDQAANQQNITNLNGFIKPPLKNFNKSQMKIYAETLIQQAVDYQCTNDDKAANGIVYDHDLVIQDKLYCQQKVGLSHKQINDMTQDKRREVVVKCTKIEKNDGGANLYDSVSDTNQMFIVYQNQQAYPMYYITYTMQ